MKNAGGALWKIAPLERGFVYESMLGLKGTFSVKNYPVIDAFYNGVATSIKTLDLGAKSYLKGNSVYNKLVNYIDDLANFKGTMHGGINTKGVIKSKVLEVGIPGANQAQREQIQRAIKYAVEKDIKINIRVVK